MLKDSIYNVIMKALIGDNQFSSPDEALKHPYFKTTGFNKKTFNFLSFI